MRMHQVQKPPHIEESHLYQQHYPMGARLWCKQNLIVSTFQCFRIEDPNGVKFHTPDRDKAVIGSQSDGLKSGANKLQVDKLLATSALLQKSK